MSEPKGFKLDFNFIPFPEAVLEADPPLLECEWRFLGYLLKQVRFGESLNALSDDEMMHGILSEVDTKDGKKLIRVDEGCGLSRNGLKKARESQTDRGWVSAENVSSDASRPRWMYRIALKKKTVTARQQVSQRDSGTESEQVSRQVTVLSQLDTAVSQNDSAVSQRDTCNKEDIKYLKKNHIENTKAEIEPAPFSQTPEQRQKQANLDTWDLRRFNEELRRLQGANVGSGGSWESDQRTAAFRAGLSPDRHIQLLKKFFPNDPDVDGIYQKPPLFAEQPEQPKPAESEDDIRQTIERSLPKTGSGA